MEHDQNRRRGLPQLFFLLKGNHPARSRLSITIEPLTMEQIREEGRSQLIRVSMILCSVLAILSFSLAKVPW
ncbi:MAG: hypothetical protein M3R08_03750 [Bacteroidota bacterium]|nr:hypothetical protein [Bacteroidota bacterium]